jgi:DsbE subfamily thiol:disulfide oxidoreductase
MLEYVYKMSAVIKTLILVVIIISLTQGCHTQEGDKGTRGGSLIDVGQKAPDAGMSEVNGGAINLENFKGKVILLNFWATWCPPCIKEMPFLEAAYEKYKAEGLVIVGINYNEDKETVLHFIQGKGVTFPVAIDKDLRMTRTYQVLSLPATFIIDRKGIIRDKYRGEMTKEIFSEKVEPLLSERGN